MGKNVQKKAEIGNFSELTFSTIAKNLYPFYGNGKTTSDFVRILFEKIAFYRDSADNPIYDYEDSLLRKIYNDKVHISKTLAGKLQAHPDADNFKTFLDKTSSENKQRIIDSFKAYIPSITKNNYSQKITEAFCKIISDTASGKKTIKNKKQNSIQLDFSEAIKSQLFLETNGYCARLECREKLSIIKDGNIQFTFTPTLVDKTKKSDDIHNLIALCPNCEKKYLTNQTKEDIENLKSIKNQLEQDTKIQDITYSEQIHNEISAILTKIPTLIKEELAELNYEPIPLANKFEKADYLLEQKINTYVQTYYRFITEQSKELEKQNLFDYELFASQFRTLFLKLEKRNISKSEIFEQLSTKLKVSTACIKESCEAVIASLVQRCDVFREVVYAST